ncbi:Heterokaryon incompatibility protein [Paramyrothecium foliicola]|nr:Heterokaryon incompatibility protein [Paramyrothecium foliicola]
MASNYSYRPLSPSDASEIRIVKLYPGKFEDDIRCELMHVSMTSEDASYIALSYTWGSPDLTEPILLDGEQFTVTQNLESFFRHAQQIALALVDHLPNLLRMPLPACATVRNHIMQSVLEDPDLSRDFPSNLGSEFSSIVQRHVSATGLPAAEQDESFYHQTSPDSCYLTFWIDSICINQRNLAEKSREVGRMKDTYSHAQSTLIWLGDIHQSAEDISPAFSLMHDIRQQVQPYLDARAEWTEAIDLITSEDYVANRSRSITGLRQILTRSWFTRVWIIQEVACAQGPIVVLVGFHSVGWTFLSNVVIPCCEYMTRSIGRPLHIMFHEDARGVRALRDLAQEHVNLTTRGAISSENAPKRLYALLQQTCGFFRATDPRDIIYAILGLLGTPAIPRQLLPDYNASVGHVFHQTALYLVRNTYQIDFLRFRQRVENDFAEVPSWVPDWRYVKMDEVRSDENLPAIGITENALGLELKGQNLGTVASVVHPSTIADAISNNFIGGNEQSQIGENDLRMTAVGILTVFRGIQRLKELCLSQAQSTMPGHSLAGFQNAWERFWLPVLGQFQPVWEMVEQRRELDLAELVEGPSSTDMVTLGHRFEGIAVTGLAITNELGLFTNYRTDSPIDHDDVVILVKGFGEPLILRPTEDSFAFVGLCELHSFQGNCPSYQEERFVVT